MTLVTIHQPVMLDETLRLLNLREGGVYVDCTVGLGGHAEAVLQRLGGHGLLIGLDRDQQSLEMARRRLSGFPNCRLYHENYKNLEQVLEKEGVAPDGCLLDLGLSSLQLDTPERGFSFRLEGPLDMRMDASRGPTAADLVNQGSREELTRIFREYGEEPRAAKIADALIRRRRIRSFTRTGELAGVVAEVVGSPRGGKIHPATRAFQALRIAVNQELTGLEDFLESTIGCLRVGGRLVVISFHSLEDRIVKRTFQKAAGRCICFRPPDFCSCPRKKLASLLTRRPLRPGDEELEANPRARSARLRAVERALVSN